MSAATNMTQEWIDRVWKDNPCVLLPNGNVRTGPVRLSFANILKVGKAVPPKTEGQYGAVLLFPVGADLSVLKQEAQRVALEKWPQAGQPNGPKLFNPFKKQDDNAGRYEGYIEGGICISANSNQKPPCVDQRMAPIVDEARVYSGVWAICTVRCYPFDKGVNKGPTFGLQSVMIVADDQNIAGSGAANPNTDFAGVQIDQNVDPAAMFGAEGPTAGASEAAPVDLFS